MSEASQGPGWWLASDGRWYPPEMHPQYRPPPPPPIGSFPYTSTQSTQAVRHRALPLTLLIGGAACTVLGVAIFAAFAIGGLLGDTVYDAPVHVVIDCSTGTYYVYQHTGHQVSIPGFSYTHTQFAALRPGQVVVVSPDGRPVRTWAASGNETITKGSDSYANAVGFNVPAAGNYSVTISPTRETAVIIAPSLGNQFLAAAPWLIITGVGLPVAIVGLVLLIRESSRRKRGWVHGPNGWQRT